MRVMVFFACRLLGTIPSEIGRLKQAMTLQLHANSLQGSIPSEVATISDMRNFRVDTNSLEGTLPSLATFREVRVFEFAFNSLTGALPTTLGLLTRKTDYLRLDYNRFSRTLPSELGDMNAIDGISIIQNHLERALPSELGRLAKVRYVGLMNNTIKGPLPTELGKMPLDGLHLTPSKLSGTLPSEMGSLQLLAYLDLANNKIEGWIPTELSRVGAIKFMDLSRNCFSGTLPQEFLRFVHAQTIDFEQNSLQGSIPKTESLSKIERLQLNSNSLQGTIPEGLTKLTSLEFLKLDYNRLEGSLPMPSFAFQELHEMRIASNELTGTMSSEIGRLGKLEQLAFKDNRFEGTLPSELGALSLVAQIIIGKNFWKGSVPSDVGRLRWLTEFSAPRASLTSTLPSEFGILTGLKLLCLDDNRLFGRLPSRIFSLSSLKVLALQFNRLSGPIPSNFGSLRAVRELCLQRNRLSGQFPSQLSRLTSYARILLFHSNHIGGELPNIASLEQLKVLTLHSNHFTGHLSMIARSPKSLGLLTLHRNRLMGEVPPFTLQEWHVDSNRFRDNAGFGCRDQAAEDCQDQLVKASCPTQCAKVNDDVPWLRPATITLHRNILSCRLPSYISNVTQRRKVRSVVLMGNFFDDPADVNWVRDEEKRVSFLFNTESWFGFAMNIVGTFTMMIALVLCYRCSLGNLGEEIARAAFTQTDDSVLLLHRVVLRDIAPGVAIATFGMIPLCTQGAHGYYTCGHKSARWTMAYFGGRSIVEYLAVIAWSFWSCFSMSFVARVTDVNLTLSRLNNIRQTARMASQGSDFMYSSAERSLENGRPILVLLVGWVFWIALLLIVAFPSIVYCVTETLPDDNILFYYLGKQGVSALYTIHKYAPLLSTMLHYLFLPGLTRMFSKILRVRRVRLAVYVLTNSYWLMGTCSVLVLHENCAGKWKIAWNMCRETKTNLLKFDVDLGPDAILDTRHDICQSRFYDIIVDDRCPRAIVDTLAPLVVGKLQVLAFLVPCLFFVKRYVKIKLGKAVQYNERWKKTYDVALIGGVIEMIVVWGALIPLVVPISALVIVVRLLMVQCRVHETGIVYGREKDDRRLSFLREHLMVSVATGSCFQFWFAFSSGMNGGCIWAVLMILVFISYSRYGIDIWTRLLSACSCSVGPVSSLTWGNTSLLALASSASSKIKTDGVDDAVKDSTSCICAYDASFEGIELCTWDTTGSSSKLAAASQEIDLELELSGIATALHCPD